MDRFNCIQAFTAVAEEGSFSGAARRLDLAKSIVSKRVSQLEDHLGVRLVNRTTRRLSLTEAGVRFHDQGSRIVEALAEAERMAAEENARPRGTLRVNAPLSFGQIHLGPALPAFLRRYPELRVELTLDDRVVDLVNDGFDAALRISRLDDSTLVAKRLAPCEHWLCASPAYLETRGTPSRPQELLQHDCLEYSYARIRHEWRLWDSAGREQRIPVRGRLAANNGEMLLEAAAQGHGIVLLPDFIAWRARAAGRVTRVLPDCRTETLDLHVVYPYTRHVSARLRVFIDFLSAHFREPAWRESPVTP